MTNLRSFAYPVLTFLIITICSACQQPEDTTNVYVHNNCGCDSGCPCDGDTTPNDPIITQMNIVLLANESVGREATMTFYRMFGNGDNELVLSFPINIQNGAIHGFAGPSGNYWVSVNGLAVTSYGEFTLIEDEVGTMVLEMYEFPLLTWYTSLSTSSPGGASTIGLNQEVMRFNLVHDWYAPIPMVVFNFQVIYTLNLDVDTCSLYEFESETGSWIQVGTAAVTDYSVQFNADDGNLMASAIKPQTAGTYSLRCDVWAPNGTNNDALQASLDDLLSWPTNVAQQFWSLPVYGNWLAY